MGDVTKIPRGPLAPRRQLTSFDTELIKKEPAFAALALRHGYSPAEFAIVRRMEMEERIDKLRGKIDDNEGFAEVMAGSRQVTGGGKIDFARELGRLEAETLAMDLKMIDYEMPKLRTIEARVEISADSEYLAALQEANERARSA